MPPKWREGLGGGEKPEFVMTLATYYGVRVARVEPESSLKHVLDDIEANPALEYGQKRAAIGRITRNVIDGQLNEQGKLLVPKAVAEELGLEVPGAVTLLGMGNHFLIVDTAKFEALDTAEGDDVGEIVKGYGR